MICIVLFDSNSALSLALDTALPSANLFVLEHLIPNSGPNLRHFEDKLENV